MTKKTNTPVAAAPVQRTTEGLRNALFEELDSLRSGQTTPQRANAVGAIAKHVIETARLDLDFMRLAKKGGASAKIAPLRLGAAR